MHRTRLAARLLASRRAEETDHAGPIRVQGGSPGPLVSAAWLADHLDDADLRLVHVSPDRRVYNKRHIPGATYSDLHKELALKGTAPETGDAEREWLIPTREQTERLLRTWRVGDGDRIVFYDDIGMNRQAIRGYWLLRLYGFPADRLHILDGGRGGLATRRGRDDQGPARGRPGRCPARAGDAERARR